MTSFNKTSDPIKILIILLGSERKKKAETILPVQTSVDREV